VVGPADEPVPSYATKVENGVISVAVD
jgi:hypothetical protein